MQSKQLALQNKLEQLGKECTSLRTELNSAVLGREETSSTLNEVEQKCRDLHNKLTKEEVYVLNRCDYLYMIVKVVLLLKINPLLIHVYTSFFFLFCFYLLIAI